MEVQVMLRKTPAAAFLGTSPGLRLFLCFWGQPRSLGNGKAPSLL